MNRDLTYSIDIANTCSTIIELIQGMSKQSFVSDKRTHLAVLYEITITGEIVKRLSSEFRQTHRHGEIRRGELETRRHGEINFHSSR